jgi:hypothetical protein
MTVSPKLPVRTSQIDLTGEYAGFWLIVRTNPPMRVFEEFASQDIARVIAALAVMTRSSNLVDERDQPVDLTTVAGWREMPGDLLAEVAERLRESLGSPKASSTTSDSPSTTGAALSLTSTT